MALTLEEMVAKRRGEKKVASAPARVDRRKAIMDRMNAEVSAPAPIVAPAPAAPAPQPQPQSSSSLGELAIWANRATQPKSRRDLESQWPTSPPKPVIAPAGPATAPAAATAPAIPSMPSDAPKVNPLLQGVETAAAPTATTAASVNPILEPEKVSPIALPQDTLLASVAYGPEGERMRAGIDRIVDDADSDGRMGEAERRALLLTGGAASKARGALGLVGKIGNVFESDEPYEGPSIRAATLKDTLLRPFRRLQAQTDEPWQIEIDRAKAIHQTVQDAMAKYGATGAFAAQFGIMGYELAVNIAMMKTFAGTSPFATGGAAPAAGKGAMAAWAARAAKEAPEVAKMFMWTYGTTPGTHDERMRAAKITAMYRATPMLSMGMPSNFTAMAVDTALNQIISLNVNPVYAELRDNAKEAAKERGIDWDKASNVQRAQILRETMTWQQATDVAFDVFTNVLFAQSTKSATKAELQSFVNEYGKTAEAYAKYLQSRGVNVDATHLTARGMEQAAWLPEMQKEIIGAQGALPASPRPAAPQDGAFSETGLRQVRDRTDDQADLDSSRRAAEGALAGPRSETPVSPDARAAIAGDVARGEALAVPRVNPILEPERVAQPAAEAEAARPAEQVAAPEAGMRTQPIDISSEANTMVKSGFAKEVYLVGSRADGTAREGSDTDVLIDLGKIDLPSDRGMAEAEIQKIIESNGDGVRVGERDYFFKAGDRYFHLSTGAGTGIVENTDYAKAQFGRPKVEVARATVDSIAPEAARAAHEPREAQVADGSTAAVRADADVGLPTPKYPVSRVSPNSIAFRPEMMQYKHIDDKETGTNKDDKISGAWDETKAGLMLLWEPKNPADHGLKPGQKHIVANGHHRLEAALQNGVGSVNVQVLREADGWSHIDARRKAAEINIADGKGSIYDQANWFRDTAATLGADAALAAGREIGARGRKAFAIGTMAGDDLYSSFLNGKITAEQAEAIAKAAPNRAELQLYGIKEAAKGKTGAELSNAVKVYKIKASKSASGGEKKQLDLLGFDESEMRAMDEQASIATRKQKEIVEQTRTLSQAISRGGKLELTDAEAKSLGIKDRNNRAEIEAARARLNDEAIRWENWSLHEDLVRQVMGDDSFKLESASKAELDAESKRLADKAKLDDMATAPLEGKPDADIGQARLPGTGGEIDLFNAPKPGADAAKPTAADLAKPIADHAKGAVTETVKGITELFKPDLGKLGSGPFVFDEGKYAKAKVHFERAWVEAKAAGNSIKEFADWAVRQFGDVIRPYIGRFVEEVENPKAAEPKPIAESPRRVNDETGYSTTSPRMAVGDPEREAIGIKPRDQIVTRHFADVADQARSKLSTVDSLISETRVGQRPVTDTEVATLLLAKTERFNSRDAAARALNADPNNAKLQQEFAEAQSKLSDVFDAIEKAGTSTARGLSAFRMTMDEKYELVNMEMDVRAAKGGQPLTDGERAYLEKIAADYKTERDVYSKQVEEAKVYTAEIETKLRGIEDQILYERIIREVEPKLTSVGTETLVELSQGGRLYANPIDPERVLSIAKWMLGKMAKGVKNPSDLAVKHLGDGAKQVIDAARDKALELVRERQAKGGTGTGKPKAKPTGEPSPPEQIRALYKAQVEAGVRDVNEATRNVTSEWNKSHDAEKQMTETQVRDTFSDYGKVTPLTKDEVKKVLAELRREAQLTSSIERAASNLHPLKTGKQRFPPSAEARALTKTLNNMLKEKGLDAVDPERQLKSIMDARKTRMLDAIEDKKRAIETMTRIPANKKPPEYDAEAKVLKAEFDKITEEYNRIFPKDVKTFTPEERLAVATKAAERSLKMATDELNAARKGIFADKKRYPDLPHNAYLEGLRAQRKIAAQEVKELRELAFPGQKAIKDRIKRMESSIRLYEHKLAVGDFTPRKPNQIDITDNPMAMLQKARMEVLKHEFTVAKEEARYNALSRKGKFKEQRNQLFRNAFNYFRNIKSSYDFSGVGRQGGLMALSNPILWAKSLPNSFKVYRSEKAGFEYWEKFQKRQNFDLYKKAELGISPGDGRGNFGPADDIFRPDIASRVPLVKRHMRAFSVVLNEFRANLFDKLLAASKDPSDLSEDKIKAIASLANSWTGRGPLPKGMSAESIGYIFWAPRFVSSAIDVSTKPFRMAGEAALDRITGSEKYDREMRGMWWKQYGRLTAGMMALYATAYAMHVVEHGNDDEFYIEMDPTSANFGNIKIPFGNHNVNPFNFVRPTLTFLARALTGEMKTAQRKKMQLAPWAWSAEAKEAGYGQRGGIKETLYDFAQTKQNPFYNSALQIATGKDFYGNDMNRLWAVISGIAPLVPSSMPNLFKAEVGTNWDNIDLERIPVFLMAGMAAIFGNQPRASDYKAPRQLKITSTKENYDKAIKDAVMKGTSETANPDAKAYLARFVGEEGEGPLFTALDSEFDKRRSEQKTYEARMRWIKRSYDTSGNITYYGIRRRNLKRVIKEAKADSEKSK